MPGRHTDREYDSLLQEVRERLLLMAGRVESMIQSSVKALMEGDVTVARNTISADHKVNRAEVETDELCLRILATRQPMASDLRFITLALKMVTDLERIGDLAVNIAERVLDMEGDNGLRPHPRIPEVTGIVTSMIRDAIDAFIAGDAAKAQQVIERDQEVDALYGVVFRDVLAGMTGDPAHIEQAIHIQSVVKWLERMADHGTNLAELVVFMVKGKDIRHMGKMGVDSSH